ncbi:MAG: hypothetical protein AAF662_11695 [Pseudomonadota bacterium]
MLSLARRYLLAPNIWVLLLLYCFAVLAISRQIPSHLSTAPWTSIAGPAGAWVVSDGMAFERRSGEDAQWTGSGEGPHFGSRWIRVAGEPQFLELTLCLADPPISGIANVFLASERRGQLDFNRQYELYQIGESGGDLCASDRFPRRTGDGAAVFQVQLHKPDAPLTVSKLHVRPLEENPRWLHTRQVLLVVGLLLVALAFLPYLRFSYPLVALAGTGIVAGILFGCLATVEVKATAYKVLTGGRAASTESMPTSTLEFESEKSPSLESTDRLPLPESVETLELNHLLTKPFPLGGFSIFTYLHAVLFFGAAFFLGLVRSFAPLEIALLAPVTEIMQMLVPGRGPGFSDAQVDWLGVAVAWILLLGLRRTRWWHGRGKRLFLH